MVTSDRDEAVRAAERGEPVVLIVAEPDPGEPAPVAARPGRIAVLVGDPADEATRAAARAMEAELFGPRSAG